MMFRAGDRVVYRLLPDAATFQGTMVGTDEGSMVLRTGSDAPADIQPGQYLVIAEEGAEADCFVEVTERTNDTLRVEQRWTGRRAFFRVDDELPLRVRKLAAGEQTVKSKVLSLYEFPRELPQPPEDAEGLVGSALWKMLADLNNKMDLVLELLRGGYTDFLNQQRSAVNISASGVRYCSAERLETGSVVEITMLLAMRYPVCVTLGGTVVRAEELRNGEYSIAISFKDISDEVEDEIVQYTLKRQRELKRIYQKTRETHA